MMLLKNSFKRFSHTVVAIVLCLSLLVCYAFAEDPTEADSTSATEVTAAAEEIVKSETTAEEKKETNETTTQAVPEETTFSAEDEKALKDLQNEYDKLEKKINQNEKKLDQVENDKSTEESKVKKLNSEISDLNSQISILDQRVAVLDSSISRINGNIDQLDSDIKKLDDDISKIDSEIADTKSSISDRYDKLKARLREAYVTGNVSDLQILLSSKDFAGFLNNMEMIEITAEYDQQMIDGLEKDLAELNELNIKNNNSKSELKSKVSQLSSERNDLSAKQSDAKSSSDLLENKQATVTAKRAESYKILSELDKDSEEFKNAIAEYEAEEKRIEAEMDRIILERGSTTNDKVEEESTAAESSENSADDTSEEKEVKTTGKYVSNPLKNMKWPVPYNNCYISAGFGYYSPFGVKRWHNGMDICVRGGSEGKDIVAAQNGKVIKTGYGDSSRGNYILIDHGSGVTTAYYHCKKLFVKEGQFVNKGDRIALIGQTGNVTGPHLHFGVHISDGNSVKKVDPAKYVSMP